MVSDIVWNFASFIVALGILVAVHEYGHFWVARRCGVKVKRFSIGFGPVLWRKKDRQGTEFALSVIPLGGYVQMLDERVDRVSDADKSYAFNNKSVYQRMAIIAAGPLANFIFAVFAFYLMFLIGVPTIKAIVGEVTPNSIAAHANIQPNSQIVSVNNVDTVNWQEVNLQLVAAIGEHSLQLKAKQADSQFVKTHQLDLQHWQFKPEQESALTTLGLTPFMPKVHTIIDKVIPGKPAALAGLQQGDQLVSINGENIGDNWRQFAATVKKHPDQQVTIELIRAGELISVAVTPEKLNQAGKVIGVIGAQPKVEPWPEQYLLDHQYGVWASVEKSFAKTWELISLSLNMITKLITGDVSIKNLSGPVSIAQGAGNSASYGFVYFLNFLALISINLGIINLLPLPVLDGGHLSYYLVEMLTGKPVPEKIQALGFKFGTIALLMLMMVAIFNDIARF